jgi:hypothetical protein
LFSALPAVRATSNPRSCKSVKAHRKKRNAMWEARLDCACGKQPTSAKDNSQGNPKTNKIINHKRKIIQTPASTEDQKQSVSVFRMQIPEVDFCLHLAYHGLE